MDLNSQNRITITNRKEIEIVGVSDIIKYDTESVIFKVDEAELSLNGSNLNVKKYDIDNKSALITGLFTSLSFSDKIEKSGKSLLKSLFK